MFSSFVVLVNIFVRGINMVPAASIVFMVISCAVGFLLPIGLLIYFRKVKQADLLPFFVGAAVMILFAFVLESSVHQIVLSSPQGAVIRNNVFLYGIYGGFMAALFEETGRLLAFRYILKKDKDANALMYGAGHGGIEAVIILGISMINNLAYSITLNSGAKDALIASVPAETAPQLEQVFSQLINTPPWQFLLGSVERVFAVVFHLAASVLVWIAVKRGGKKMFAAAFLIHFLIDCVTAITAGLGVPTRLVEILIGIMTAAAVLFTRKAARDYSYQP